MQDKKPRYGWTRQEVKEYIIYPAIASVITSALSTLLLLHYL